MARVGWPTSPSRPFALCWPLKVLTFLLLASTSSASTCESGTQTAFYSFLEDAPAFANPVLGDIRQCQTGMCYEGYDFNFVLTDLKDTAEYAIRIHVAGSDCSSNQTSVISTSGDAILQQRACGEVHFNSIRSQNGAIDLSFRSLDEKRISITAIQVLKCNPSEEDARLVSQGTCQTKLVSATSFATDLRYLRTGFTQFRLGSVSPSFGVVRSHNGRYITRSSSFDYTLRGFDDSKTYGVVLEWTEVEYCQDEGRSMSIRIGETTKSFNTFKAVGCHRPYYLPVSNVKSTGGVIQVHFLHESEPVAAESIEVFECEVEKIKVLGLECGAPLLSIAFLNEPIYIRPGAVRGHLSELKAAAKPKYAVSGHYVSVGSTFHYTLTDLNDYVMYLVRLEWVDFEYCETGREFDVQISGGLRSTIKTSGSCRRPVSFTFEAVNSVDSALTVSFFKTNDKDPIVRTIDIRACHSKPLVDFQTDDEMCHRGEALQSINFGDSLSSQTSYQRYDPDDVDANSVSEIITADDGSASSALGIFSSALSTTGSFTFTVRDLEPSKNYYIRLHFAEHWLCNHSRKFTVRVQNGPPKLIDVYGSAGCGQASVEDFTDVISTRHGQVIINFGAVKENPIVSALQVFECSKDRVLLAKPHGCLSGENVLSVNFGERDLDSAGFSKFKVSRDPLVLARTSQAGFSDTVYEELAWCDKTFVYELPGLSNLEQYSVELHFMESFRCGRSNEREFEVRIGDETRTINVYKAVGCNQPYVVEFNNVVPDGSNLVVEFVKNSNGPPMISAIRVFQCMSIPYQKCQKTSLIDGVSFDDESRVLSWLKKPDMQRISAAQDTTIVPSSDIPAVLYQESASGDGPFSFTITGLSPQFYLVRIHFIENSLGLCHSGARLFSVAVDGVWEQDIDIFERAGGCEMPYVHDWGVVPSFFTTSIEVVFFPSRRAGWPCVAAIEVMRADDPIKRINFGVLKVPGFENADLADFTGADVHIRNPYTVETSIYTSYLTSPASFSYSLPVPEGGIYMVSLIFSERELMNCKRGTRVFDALVDDREIREIDVFASAGCGTRHEVDFHSIYPSGGEVSVSVRRRVGNPIISAIQVFECKPVPGCHEGELVSGVNFHDGPTVVPGFRSHTEFSALQANEFFLAARPERTEDKLEVHAWSWDSFAYVIGDLDHAPYTIVLHFSEVYTPNCENGKRVFSVSCSKETIRDLDIFKLSGCHGHHEEVLRSVTPRAGYLSIWFMEMGHGAPMISALELYKGNEAAGTVIAAIDFRPGDQQLARESNHTRFLESRLRNSSDVYLLDPRIEKEHLYRDYAWSPDTFSYTIQDLDDKETYGIRFHFVEHYSCEVGRRVFDVSAGGKSIKNLDIFAKVGCGVGYQVDIESVPAIGGEIAIYFTNIGRGSPSVSAIESYRCVMENNSDSTCLQRLAGLSVGETCVNDNMCQSGICYAEKCGTLEEQILGGFFTKLGFGESCLVHGVCQVEECYKGRCGSETELIHRGYLPKYAIGASCLSGLVCETNSCFDGLCGTQQELIRDGFLASLSLGQSCATDGVCGVQQCYKGRCGSDEEQIRGGILPKRKTGSPCSAKDLCLENKCSEGLCGTAQSLLSEGYTNNLGIGEHCSTALDCESRECFAGRCGTLEQQAMAGFLEQLGAGGSCHANAACRSGHFCVKNICRVDPNACHYRDACSGVMILGSPSTMIPDSCGSLWYVGESCKLTWVSSRGP